MVFLVKSLLLLLVAPAALSLAGTGGAAPGPTAAAPYLAATNSFDVTSRVSGRTFQISVSLPRGYDPGHGPYPVVFTVDANSEYGLVVTTTRLLTLDRRMPPTIVVGIGYDRPGVDFDTSFAERSYDLTPTVSAKDLAWLVPYAAAGHLPAPTRTGGARAFYAFIREELTPLLEGRYAMGADRTIFGHSFGGLFGTYVLLQDDGFFRRFVLGSPSLGWDDGILFKDEERLHAVRADLPARVYIGAGAGEETADEQMVSDAVRFAAHLRGRRYRGLSVTSEVVPGEDHTSVVPVVLLHGLEEVFHGPSADAVGP